MTEASIGVLLPARLETRFKQSECADEQGQKYPCWKLHIAVIPDEPWMSGHSETVSQAEVESLERLWQACANDAQVLKTTREGAAAFRRLAQEVGAARAWWLVTTYGPGADIVPGQKSLSRMDALPEQIEIWLGIKEGEEIVLKALEPPMKVKKEALIFDGEDGSALNLFANGRWWTEEAGLQKEYELPFSSEEELQQIELILAVGLGGGSPRDLFKNHRNAGALSLLPLGAPTNTISGASAADLAKDPEVWWRLLSDAGEVNTKNDLSLALTGESAVLKDVPGGTREHRRLNEELLRLLWPALWEHTLRDIWCVDRELGWREQWDESEGRGQLTFSYWLGLWADELLHPEGPLAPLRIGDQPYGLWPVTRLGEEAWQAADGDPMVERVWLESWLPKTRQAWAKGTRNNSGTVAGKNSEQFTALLGRTPSGSGYAYRTFLPIQAMYFLSQSIWQNVDEASNWYGETVRLTEEAANDLGFMVKPVRRYMTSGWPQDLEPPLVEAPATFDPAGGLGRGWKHITGTAGGSLFFYNAALGEGKTARIDKYGNYREVATIPGFSSWTHVVSANRNALLFYNAETGGGATAWLDDQGGYHYGVPIDGFRTGWTHIAGTANGGLLFYDAATGDGATAWLSGTGAYKSGQTLSGFSPWTHIVGAGRGGLFFYNSENGQGATARLYGTGSYEFRSMAAGELAPGWTHVTGTAGGGLLFYNAETGESATAYLDNSWQYHYAYEFTGLVPGWSHVAGTERGLLFYDAAGGRGETALLEGNGSPRYIGFCWSVFFSQLEELYGYCQDQGFAELFKGYNENCELPFQPESLLLRLIINSIARLLAEMGRMNKNPEREGLPLIEPFDLGDEAGDFCSRLQEFAVGGGQMNLDMLLQDDGFLTDLLHGDENSILEIQEWPLVRLARSLFETMLAWYERYLEAQRRDLEAGGCGALKQLLADIERVFRATLDTAAVRIDPWITGMAWRRLEKLRGEGRPDGLGLYAWVDRPYTGTPGPTDGGTLLAPSYDQLLTALIMRDKHIYDPQEDRWKMEMDSLKVRRAKRFADEVRGGAHIQELLGRAVEEIVGNKDQIEALRKQFKMRDEHDGRRTCDGQKVLNLLKTAEGLAKLQELGLLKHQTALEELAEVVNTYADLLVANSVHAVVSGRPEKAGETMDAAAGLELPPHFDVLRTPRAGYSVNTTVWLALPVDDLPEPGDSPALLADTAAAVFLEQAEPAARWVWHVKQGEGRVAVRLADLGLRPSEALAYSEDGLRQLAIGHVDGGEKILEVDEVGQPLSPAGPAYRRLRRLAALLSGHVRDVHNTRDDEEAALWQEHDTELLARLEKLIKAAEALEVVLDQALADPAALIQARRWGIAPAPLDDAHDPEEHRLTAEEQLKRQLELAGQTLGDRKTRAQALLQAIQLAQASGEEVSVQQITRAISDLSGNSLPIYGRARRTMLEVSEPLKSHAALDREWLETVAAVRPTLARIEAHQLGPEPGLHTWCDSQDPWAYEGVSAEKPLKRPTGVVICYSPAAQLGDKLAVAVLDSWSEMVPDKQHIAEAAFGFNAPSSRAPQAILLAVPPDESKPLDTETLAHIVFEARETAHARMATPEDIEEDAVLFPLAMVPAQGPAGVSMAGDQVVR